MTTLQNTTTMKLQFGELTITSRVAERLHELDFTVSELETAIALHKSCADGTPSVYVGTYGKYNNGSLRGLWIDLSTFDDYDDFINFCEALHADETAPELMAQDFEGFPREYYNEGFITREDFGNIKEYTELCEKYGAEAVADYLEIKDTIDGFEDAYCGCWDSEADFARNIVEECYDLEKTMGNLSCYFDYDAFARDLFMCDYYMGSNGYVFNLCR